MVRDEVSLTGGAQHLEPSQSLTQWLPQGCWSMLNSQVQSLQLPSEIQLLNSLAGVLLKSSELVVV